MDQDDKTDRTVTKPQAKVYVPPAEDDATVIRPAGATRIEPRPASAPAAAPEMGNHLPVGTYLAEFEITELLGEGGFGIVYLARDHSLQRRVALKEYMPSALAARTGPTQVAVKSERHRETFEAGLKSFVNEARLLAQFDHPSLVKVYRFWEANGTAYMVMPFYEGITLKQKLKEMGAAPNEAWLMDLLGPLTEALEVIHAEQCFHRDIAPDNVILLKGNGRPLLLDFGAARRVIGDMTQALTVILKPGYAPVEQYAEVPGMKQGPWTDVYALAAVVYYAITGKTPPTSVGRLMNDGFVPLSQLAQGRYSAKFTAAIDRALVVKPEERTQSVAELRHDLGLDTMAPQPFDPLKDFERVVAAQSADFGVEAATARQQFRIDRDFLSFSVKSEKEGHLYVFLHGSDGVLLQVFPNSIAKNNRLRAGQTITLPPPQSNWAMKASGPPGTDHFIAIVSAWPRDFSAVGLQVQDGYGQASTEAVAAAARTHGAATPLFMGKAVCSGECTDHFGAALFSSEQIP
jgi:serine/threonine protein kinase